MTGRDRQQPGSTEKETERKNLEPRPGGYQYISARDDKPSPGTPDDMSEKTNAIINAQVSLIRSLNMEKKSTDCENDQLTAELALIKDQYRQFLVTQRNAMMLLIDSLQKISEHLSVEIQELERKKEELNCETCNGHGCCKTCEFDIEAVSGIKINLLSAEQHEASLEQLISIVEELNQTAKEMEEGNREKNNQVEMLTLEIQLMEQTKEKYKAPCGCDRRLFRRERLVPHVDKAEEKFHKAVDARKEKDEEKESTRDQVASVIYSMLRKATKAQFGKLFELSSAHHLVDISEELLEERSRLIAAELVSIEQIRSQEVAHIIDQNGLLPGPHVSVVANDIKGYRKICKALHAMDYGNGYIGMLESTIKDINVLNLKRIWNEMDRLSQREEEISGPIANGFCDAFYGDFTLDEEVRQTHDLEKLKEIAHRATHKVDSLPITAAGFHKLLSVVAKLRMMHMSNTIENTIDREKMKMKSKHLRQKIYAYTGRTNTNKAVLSCDHPEKEIYDEESLKENPHAIAVHSITVAKEKQNDAIARKISEKDHDQSKNYGVADIKDPLRLEVVLTPEDSRTTLQEGETEPPAYIMIKKALSILISILGTDIPDGRLKYSIESGMSNPNSTGNNFAFQITFLYKCQCCVNGKHADGRTKTDENWVEVQIRLFMNADEKSRPRELHRKKDRKIRRLSGVDISFHDHLLTLAERVLTEHERPISARHDPKTKELSEKEKEAKILFMSLLAKNEQGTLANENIIQLLLLNRKSRKTLLAAAKKYEAHQILPHRNREKAGLQYKEGPTQLNIMAKEVIQMIHRYERSSSSQLMVDPTPPPASTPIELIIKG